MFWMGLRLTQLQSFEKINCSLQLTLNPLRFQDYDRQFQIKPWNEHLMEPFHARSDSALLTTSKKSVWSTHNFLLKFLNRY